MVDFLIFLGRFQTWHNSLNEVPWVHTNHRDLIINELTRGKSQNKRVKKHQVWREEDGDDLRDVPGYYAMSGTSQKNSKIQKFKNSKIQKFNSWKEKY